VQNQAPAPLVANFLPANFRVTNTMQVNLDNSATPQLAVTAVGTPAADSNGAGFVPSTVLLLAWDPIAKRWTSVFDASKQQSWQSTPHAGAAGPGLLQLNEQGPAMAVIHDQSGGKSDLVYWLNSIEGNGGVLLIGVVHYADQIANVTYNFSGDEGDGKLSSAGLVKAIGVAPRQQIQVTAPWQTAADDRMTYARLFHFVVAPTLNDGTETFSVVSDDRPLVGIGLLSVEGTSQGEVAYVAGGSPAVGVLQVGDIIDGIDGQPATATSSIGPAVIDQVAQHHPGDSIALDIERSGQRRVVNLKLAMWNLPTGQTDYTNLSSGSLGLELNINGTSVVATQVVSGGPADTAGIPAGSTITVIGGLQVHSLNDCFAAAIGTSPGQSVQVNYVGPDGVAQAVSVQMGSPSSDTPTSLTAT
jgi:hypothetical protein